MRDPGEYDKRMILMQPAMAAATASGQQAEVGAEVARMWCKLSSASGREYPAAGQVRAEASHAIYTPYRADIAVDSTCWLLYGTRRFDIESIVVDDAGEEFLISVREHL